MPETSAKESSPDKETPSKETKEISVLKSLQAAAKGLLFPSEADKPVKAFLWKKADLTEGKTFGEGEITDADLKVAGKLPEGATAETTSLTDFFAPVVKEQDWFGSEEKETAQRFQKLADLLNQRLTNVTVLQVKGGEEDGSKTDVYAVGRTAEGDLAGVSTQLVTT
jgi:hypothetical protein